MLWQLFELDHLSPPEVAEILGVGHCKVLGWILRGELRAADLCTVRGQRPRYKIARVDLDTFLARRSTTAELKPRRQSRKKDKKIIEYY